MPASSPTSSRCTPEIEEKLFYPESKQENTEDILRESVEEHLSMKRILADLMEVGADDEQFDAKMRC